MQIKRDVLPKEPAGFPAEDKTGDRVEKLGWNPALTLRQCVTVWPPAALTRVQGPESAESLWSPPACVCV